MKKTVERLQEVILVETLQILMEFECIYPRTFEIKGNSRKSSRSNSAWKVSYIIMAFLENASFYLKILVRVQEVILLEMFYISVIIDSCQDISKKKLTTA